MARKLKKLPEEMIVFGIEGISFEFGAPRSAEVEAAVEEVEAAILKEFGVGE
jgi:hypothetical protein